MRKNYHKQIKISPIITTILLCVTIISSCSVENKRTNQNYSKQSNLYKNANNILVNITPATGDAHKQELLLSAAESYISANLMHKAVGVLAKVEADKLSNKQSTKYHLLQAKVYLNSNESTKALDAIEEINDFNNLEYSNGNHKIEEIINKDVVSAFSKNDDARGFEELNFRAELNNKLSSNHELSTQNNKNIWHKLITQNNNTIHKLLTRYKNEQHTEANISNRNKEIINNNLIGWLELAKISKNANNINNHDYITKIKSWQSQFRYHPANNYFNNFNNSDFANFANDYQRNYHYTAKKIAVLLPFTGNLAPAANAIKNGILSGYYLDKRPYKPEIVFIDTKSDSANIANYYQQAVAQHADIILGPLDKQEVANLNNNYDNKTPVIALNYIPEGLQQGKHGNFYQLGISAEDEAVQAATKSWQSGFNNSLIIADDNAWGYRVGQAYKNKFEELSGNIANITFINSKSNYKKLIYSTLGIEESQKRKNTLQWILGDKIAFKPRRRLDIDNIFLVTTSKEAKQIKPILKFYYADNIPIIATSNIIDYKLYNDKSQLKDLSNIEFCDIPLIINPELNNNKLLSKLQKTWPQNYDKLIRLYALGIDAYQLSYNLNKLKISPQMGIASNTGHLILESNGKITRQLPWAKIHNSSIKTIELI
jgi:outer membrane PBP1 activator LpoA protein